MELPPPIAVKVVYIIPSDAQPWEEAPVRATQAVEAIQKYVSYEMSRLNHGERTFEIERVNGLVHCTAHKSKHSKAEFEKGHARALELCKDKALAGQPQQIYAESLHNRGLLDHRWESFWRPCRVQQATRMREFVAPQEVEVATGGNGPDHAVHKDDVAQNDARQTKRPGSSPDPAFWFLARTNTLQSPPKQTDQYQFDHHNYTKYHRMAYSLMLADIKDRDRYCKKTDKEVFVVKLCAGVGAIEHR